MVNSNSLKPSKFVKGIFVLEYSVSSDLALANISFLFLQ